MLLVYLRISKVIYVPGDTGFLPSTVFCKRFCVYFFYLPIYMFNFLSLTPLFRAMIDMIVPTVLSGEKFPRSIWCRWVFVSQQFGKQTWKDHESTGSILEGRWPRVNLLTLFLLLPLSEMYRFFPQRVKCDEIWHSRSNNANVSEIEWFDPQNGAVFVLDMLWSDVLYSTIIHAAKSSFIRIEMMIK